MGVAKRTRKFAQVKRLIGQRDVRLEKNKAKQELLNKTKKESASGEIVREIPQAPSGMFFAHNQNLVPPYQVLMVNTNFFSHTVRMKLPVLESAMDCLYASVNPIITSCVMAELEKLGPKYKVALMQARDERFARITCDHQGTYADDCIVDRIQKHRIYIVATNDKDLKKRIRKVPGVPIMSVARGKYVIERLPGAPST